ncbi:MAG: hypothetical protein ABI401_10805 [Candidatus Dormibacter sp.]
MKTLNGLVAATAVASIALTGCGTNGVTTSAKTGQSGYRLFAVDMRREGAPISVLDAASGRVERSLPLGTPSPDWSRLYALTHDKQRTTVQAVDTHTGKVASHVSFDGWFDLPIASPTGQTGGLSPNGQWLVLQGSGEAKQTSFMLVVTAFNQAPRRIVLPGDLSFDAVSNDGSRLYLIESLAKTQPGHYRVRRYDVATGSLNPTIIVDKREILSASMTGTRISGVSAPDGSWQYSLYINEKTGPFIHALSLDQTFAWCIDLPAGGTQQEQVMWSLAITADGSHLFAVNPALGKVARVDITGDGPSNEISQVASFTPPVRQQSQASALFTDALAKGVQIGSAAVAPDGKTLIAIADAGTIAIELPSLKPIRTLFSDEGVESVVMSDDGAKLFASSWSGSTLLEIDPTTGKALATLHLTTTYVLYRAQRR